MIILLTIVVCIASPVWTIIAPMVRSNGSLDTSSVATHVLLIEQTIANIQAQAQSDARANSAQFAVLQSQMTKMKSDLESAQNEVAALRGQLVKTQTELVQVKSQLNPVLNQTTVNTNFEASLQEIRQNLTVIQNSSVGISTTLNTTVEEVNRLKSEEQSTTAALAAHVGKLNLLNRTLHQTLQSTAATVHSSQQSVLQIHASVTTLTSRLNNLVSSVHKLSSGDVLMNKSISYTKSHLTATDRNVARLQHDLNRTSLHSSAHTASIKALQKTVDTLKNVPVVSFDVGLHTNFNTAGTRILRLQSVMHNEINGYNSHTGHFTAPVSGVYLFWTTVNGRQDRPFSVNMQTLGKAAGVIAGVQCATSCTIHRVISLTKGTRVACFSSLYGTSTLTYASFAGTLLFPH